MKQTIQVDTLVVGAGAAGIAAACGARSAGSPAVVVLEAGGYLGGMATQAEVGTICGLYYNGLPYANFANPGFCSEFAEKIAQVSCSVPKQVDRKLWILPYKPADFINVANSYFKEYKIDFFPYVKLESVTGQSRLVNKVSAWCFDRQIDFIANKLIDCSGQSIIARSLNAEILPNKRLQAAAIVFDVENIDENQELVVNRALALSIFRAEEKKIIGYSGSSLSLVPSSLKNRSASLKLSLPMVDSFAVEQIKLLDQQVKSIVPSLVSFLKDDQKIFSRMKLSKIASNIGIRTGVRTLGRAMLTYEDVINCKKSEHSVGRGVWPIEEWLGDRRPNMEYLPDGDYYDIPLGVLHSKDLDNLFLAGKNISADDRAIASARVIGSCLLTGYQAGRMAMQSFITP